MVIYLLEATTMMRADHVEHRETAGPLAEGTFFTKGELLAKLSNET